MNASGKAQHILVDTLCDRSFKASAPKRWNRLPSNIRAVNDLNCFKTLLKTHFFRQAFHVTEMMQFLLEIRKTVNIKMFHSFLVTWIGMLQTMTSLKTYQRLTKVLARILMTMHKTPDFHVFKALGKVASAELVRRRRGQKRSLSISIGI